MGAVITFPRVRRGLCKAPSRLSDVSAAVIILPVIRIERAYDPQPSGTETEGTTSSFRRKRRKRASRL
jgi:hypothetical protein